MTISVLQHLGTRATGGLGSVSLQFASNVTAGSTLLVAGIWTAGYYAGGGLYNPVVTDDRSHVFTADIVDSGAIGGGSNDTGLYASHTYNVAGGVKPTVTATIANTNAHEFTLYLVELGGAFTISDPLDQVSAVVRSTSGAASVTATTTGTLGADGECVYTLGVVTNTTNGLLPAGADTNLGTPSGFTGLDTSAQLDAGAYRVLAGGHGSTTSAAWPTTDGNDVLAAVVLTFKAALTGPSGPSALVLAPAIASHAGQHFTGTAALT